MAATSKTVVGRKSHGLRQAIVGSSTATVRTPAEAGTRGSGANPPPLLSKAEIEAYIPESQPRFGGDSTTSNETAKKHERLVSVGQHESRGIPDARYLGIADRVLNQQENEEESVEVLAAHSREGAPSPKSNARTRRDARYLLHYRQD
jgi:hypothetical protein